MAEVNLSLDKRGYEHKPAKEQMRYVNYNIAHGSTTNEIKEIAELIGNQGHAFCPATYSDGKRRKSNYESQQLIALDFDDGISYQVIKARTEEYLLPICFAYYTYSSTVENERFRVVFMLDCVLGDISIAETIICMFRYIFPESDKQCSDATHIFLGAHNSLIENNGYFLELADIVYAFSSAMKHRDRANFKRSITTFAVKHGVTADENNLVKVEKIANIDDFSTSSYYLMPVVKKSSEKAIFYAIKKMDRDCIRDKNSSQDRQKYSQKGRFSEFKYADRYCRLYKEFINGIDVGHHGRFLLLTSFIQVRGGKMEFLKIIKDTGFDLKKWADAVNSPAVKDYKHEMSCDRCPYADECNHLGSLLETVRDSVKKYNPQKEVIVNTQEHYVSLEDARCELKNNILEAIDSSTRVTLIKAQTGIGKTYTYRNIIREQPWRKFVVALPNNDMKNEVARDLLSMGIDTDEMVVTPSHSEDYFPDTLRNELNALYERGIYGRAPELIGAYLKENQNIDAGLRMRLEEFLNFKDKMKEARIIITTHTRLATFEASFLDAYTVIIDEDILVSSFFMHTREISVESIQNAVNSLPFAAAIPAFNKVLSSKDGEIIKSDTWDCNYRHFTEEELEDAEVYENINDALRAAVFMKKGDVLKYYYPGKLPNTKCIILSATLDIDIYKKYFRIPDNDICYIEGNPAKYQGRVIQYVAHTLGRNKLSRAENWIKIQNLISKSINPNSRIITFKKFQECIENAAQNLYFSKCIGSNRLKGQDIAVVGTPFGQDDSYKMIGAFLGAEECSDEGRLIRATYKDKEFCHFTYKDPFLRQLQCYWITSELEQAVGRARLLSNACTVLVFASVPVEQAEYHTSDYLK